MKKFLKNNIKLFVGILIGIVLSITTSFAATIILNSDEVQYDNTSSGMTSTNVQDALDELYGLRPTGTAGAEQVLSGYTFSNSTASGISGSMPTLTSSNFSGTHSSTTAGAASNYTVKSTSAGYVANNTTVNTLTAGTSSTIATTSATGTQTINVKPGYYNKISVNQTNAYNAGKSAGAASWVSVWTGSTTGNISVSLSAYKYVVIKNNGGPWLILQVGGSEGCTARHGTSPDGVWGNWMGGRCYKATTSGITATTGTMAGIEDKGASWISITNVWGIKNLN